MPLYLYVFIWHISKRAMLVCNEHVRIVKDLNARNTPFRLSEGDLTHPGRAQRNARIATEQLDAGARLDDEKIRKFRECKLNDIAIHAYVIDRILDLAFTEPKKRMIKIQ